MRDKEGRSGGDQGTRYLGEIRGHDTYPRPNLVTSILPEDRVETTITKAKAARLHVEKLPT